MVMLMPPFAHAAREISPNVVAAQFAARVKDFIGALDAHTDDLAVRINRCVGRQGEVADDRFYAWIGWRGVAPADNAFDVIAGALATMRAAGWEVTRDRRLANGGVNVTATDPSSGQTYSLDSGFDAGPNSYIVGFFYTRCFNSTSDPVVFGPWKQQ